MFSFSLSRTGMYSLSFQYKSIPVLLLARIKCSPKQYSNNNTLYEQKHLYTFPKMFCSENRLYHQRNKTNAVELVTQYVVFREHQLLSKMGKN